MPARSRHGSNRIVIQLSDENYLAVMCELTPEGQAKPPFGVVTKFFNGLVENWRAHKAAAPAAKEAP